MNKKSKIAFSTMGFAIVIVIILGIVMIVSAPMIVDSSKKHSDSDKQVTTSDKNNLNSDYAQRERDKQDVINNGGYSNSQNSSGNVSENSEAMGELSRQIQHLESNVNERISRVEQQTAQNGVSNKYVCAVEGYVDPAGNMIAIDRNNTGETIARQSKLVFVCEYKK